MRKVNLSRQPRVLLVLNRFRPMIGGAERQCELLCENLEGSVEWVAVLTHRYDVVLPIEETMSGVMVCRIGTPSPHGIAPLSFYRALARKLWSERSRYDLIHCHTAGMTGLLTAFVGRVLRKPVLLKLTAAGELSGQLTRPSRDSGVMVRFKSMVRSAIAGFALRGEGTHIVALTAEGGREALQCGVQHAHIIPNGVDHARYQQLQRIPQAGVVRFGYCGRLTAEKGTHVLADVFELLADRGAAVTLLVAGSGDRQLQSSENRLNAVASRWPDCLQLVGTLTDIRPFLAGLDVYLSASTYEGLPNAVLEALASGLPCVLSDIDAHRELVRLNPDANIRLFRAGDVSACVSAVDAVLSDWPLAPSVLALDLQMHHVAQRYLSLYSAMQVAMSGPAQ